MSSKRKKRKFSMEPVLQDFTVTSFSDLHPDGAGSSDSSLFEEIKNKNVEISEITFNQTGDINLLSGPYPSDSSLDSLIKLQSNSKKNPEAHRPFQKRSRKKSVEENLFDSCLKDSFSDNSLETVKKPFQRKHKNEVRLSIFDSDLESNTSVRDSPFKKPFQRKSKNKRQSNLFDSLVEDSQPNTPDQHRPRLFQMKSKNKISSNFFDDVFSNDSINQPSPVQNFITRRKNRMKKSNESYLFDEDFGSSQSDVSMPLQPLCFRRKMDSNNIQNCTGMFDDLLDVTGNESQNEKFSVLDPCNKNNCLNEDNTKSFNLEYNIETGGDDAKGDDSSKNEETREAETEDEGSDQYEENKKENKFTAELPNQRNTSPSEECLKLQEHVDKDKSVVQLPKQIDLVNQEEAEEQNGEKCELPNQQHPLEHRSENLECDGTKGSDRTEGEIDSKAELTESIQLEPEDEDTIQFESEEEDKIQFEPEDEDTIQFESENEEKIQFETEYIETIQFEKENEGTRRSEENEKEIESRAESPKKSDLPNDEKIKETENSIKKQSFTDSLSQFSSYMKNSNNRDRALEVNDSAKYIEASEGTSQYKISDVREINFSESVHCSGEITLNDNNSQESILQTLPLPKLSPDFEPSEMKINDKEMLISTPEESFKCMPSSTPNAKGKRVSFLLKEETCLRGSKENNVNNNDTSTRRKSSLRSHKGNNDSGIVNNLAKDNSMNLRKRRVSFKVDDKGNDSLKQSDVKNSDKLEQSTGNQTNNYYSSVSIESLVYPELSGSRTPDSESFYIDIHPSRGNSTCSSNTESISQAKSKSFKTDSCTGDTKRCENDQFNVSKENGPNIEGGHENDNLDNNCCVEEKTIENTNNGEEFSNSENELEGEEEEESDVEEEVEEESDVEEEVEEESDGEEEVEEESDVEEEVEEEAEFEEKQGQDATAEEQLSEQESEEEQDLFADDQETERHSNEKSVHKEFGVNNFVTSLEQDENVNPCIKITEEFKLPLKKKFRTSSLFKEKFLEVPSKSQLQDILNNIPASEFKTRKKRKLSEQCISSEQMQQYEIEEELMRNHKKKTQNKGTFSASSKLKRPKKWISPRLYNFLINKLKPQYGIRSRVRAEELVLFLVEHVECIKKKKELIREDVEEIKIELARLGIIKTHWDFFKFINQYFEYHFKEKLYPSLPGVGRSAFEFGPTNVMENILESV